MNHKKIIWVLLIVSLLILGGIFGIALADYFLPSFHDFLYRIGDGNFVEGKIHPVFFAFLPLLFITSILFFVRRETFLAWAKFAAPAFPLMLVVLLYTHNNVPVTGGWIGGPTDDQLATVFLPPLFLIISLLIIGIKSWKLKHSK